MLGKALSSNSQFIKTQLSNSEIFYSIILN
jgi:hypothetical protein